MDMWRCSLPLLLLWLSSTVPGYGVLSAHAQYQHHKYRLGHGQMPPEMVGEPNDSSGPSGMKLRSNQPKNC